MEENIQKLSGQKTSLGKLPGKERFQVSRVFGAYYEIYNSGYGRVLSRLRGNLRLHSPDLKNPVVVGDFVVASQKSGDWVIENREERKSLLIRKSNPRDTHALCANADYAIVLAGLRDPETKYGFIDRFLASVSVSLMEPIIVFTKKDLVSPKEAEGKKDFYQSLGYNVLLISIYEPDSYQGLLAQIRGKTSFFCGNSGVGKSSLVNEILGREVQQTQEISHATHKGRHTTTNSTAFFLDHNTVIIDSPGIKEWGVLHLSTEEILLSLPELQTIQNQCKHSYCCYLDSRCPILEAINHLPEERKESLESMLHSLEKPFRKTRRDHWEEAEKLR